MQTKLLVSSDTLTCLLKWLHSWWRFHVNFVFVFSCSHTTMACGVCVWMCMRACVCERECTDGQTSNLEEHYVGVFESLYWCNSLHFPAVADFTAVYLVCDVTRVKRSTLMLCSNLPSLSSDGALSTRLPVGLQAPHCNIVLISVSVCLWPFNWCALAVCSFVFQCLLSNLKFWTFFIHMF